MKCYRCGEWPCKCRDGITLIHGDCRDVLPIIPVASATVTDPPYGIGLRYGQFEDTPENVQSLILDVWPQLPRPILATTGQKCMGFYPTPDWVLCWFVPSGSGVGPWGFVCWHPVLAYGKDPYRPGKEGSRPDGFEAITESEKLSHPCPKPLKIMRRLVERVSTNAEDTILDPFAGSGTTLVAAKQLGRKAIGIELEERYCEIAANRLRQEVLQFTE